MFEKVNPSHSDKLCDIIAGAVVDLAYKQAKNPRIAVEVLLGHGVCHIIAESSVPISLYDVECVVHRIVDDSIKVDFVLVAQDEHLAKNQDGKIRCGDNGIFKGVPVTKEQKLLTKIAKDIYKKYPYDGKYILDGKRLIICQSNVETEELQKEYPTAIINPIGYWTGGSIVDSGATNRKLGSDMADSVTGGGLCLSGDSEFLSDDFKWHKISEYKGQKVAQWNNGVLEFVQPLKFIHNKNEELYHIYNQSKLSMCLTPYHNVLLKTSKGNLIKKPAIEIINKLKSKKGNLGSIIHNFIYNANCDKLSKFPNEAMYRLQVAFCADGTITNGKRWTGRIRVKKEYKKERLRKLLVEAKMKYMESIDDDYSIFYFCPTVVSKSLYDCFKDENWDVLYNEIFRWDGDLNKKVFRTTIKEDAEFIQLVISSKGKFAKINACDRINEIKTNGYVFKSILYSVNELKSVNTHLRQGKSDIFIEKTCGDSYCFEVPSHNLIIRHNERVFITGNCGKDLSKADVSVNIYAFLKAQKENRVIELSCAIGDEFVDGKPYSEIVEIARNYIESLGGFEEFAKWGLVR